MNLNNFNTADYNAGEVYDLVKAMSAGSLTGQGLVGTETSGASLKTESLDPMLKILTSRDKHIVLWNEIPKDKAYNTVEEYNQLIDYGLNVGIFNAEGATPNFTDSIYKRNSALVKFMGVAGEVTHPMTLVRLGSGVTNALAQEVQNKTSFLIRALDKAMPTANSKHLSYQFDGIFHQHFVGVTGQTGSITAANLTSYFNDSSVVDARGGFLTDALVEDAAHAVVNDNFGMISSIMAPPIVFNNYVKQFHESKRVLVNNPVSATNAGVMGQKVNTIVTQFGDIDVKNDIFFDWKKAKLLTDAATHTDAPTKPAKGNGLSGSVSVLAVSDALGQFLAAYAGNYYYAVSALNQYGESALTLLNVDGSTAVTVANTESVDLDFNDASSGNATAFTVYRTEAGQASTGKFHPIFTISATELAAGWDGGASTVVRDRNRFIANTYSAIIYDNSAELWAFKQLAPIMRMDLARTSPSYRFMILAYGTPVLFAPKKMTIIRNLGARTIS